MLVREIHARMVEAVPMYHQEIFHVAASMDIQAIHVKTTQHTQSGEPQLGSQIR